MLNCMKSLYGDGMQISRGKKHDYLGMNLHLSVKGQVTVTMLDYLKGLISDFEEVEILTSTAASPSAKHLYTIREECDQKKLNDKRGMAFHHTVAQLLFAFPRARKDIYTDVSFLTTRVCDRDEDDWGKLKRMMRYIS